MVQDPIVISPDITNQILKNQEIVNQLKKRIKELDADIKNENKNLKNITPGFKELTYSMIDKNVLKKKELQRIMDCNT